MIILWINGKNTANEGGDIGTVDCYRTAVRRGDGSLMLHRSAQQQWAGAAAN